jgi:hypothetical protein
MRLSGPRASSIRPMAYAAKGESYSDVILRRRGLCVSSFIHAPAAIPTSKVQKYVRTTNMFTAYSRPGNSAATPASA